MPDPGGNIYPFPGHGGPQFFVPLHTYINIPPWFSKQNSPSRLAAGPGRYAADTLIAQRIRAPKR